MVKKKTIKVENVEEIKQTKDTIFFKAQTKLTEKQYKLLGDMIRHEMKETGKTIVLVPFCCEVGE